MNSAAHGATASPGSQGYVLESTATLIASDYPSSALPAPTSPGARPLPRSCVGRLGLVSRKQVYSSPLVKSTPVAERERSTQAVSVQPLLSVVVPVYNQADSITESVQAIQERVAEALGGTFEIIVVSDGSIDQTEERLLDANGGPIRVIHYDRNLGKGYAVKIGSLAARGRWISFIDADLEVDPSSLVPFLEAARTDSLDIAIGSKRHPESVVHYPRGRRIASWAYQQLVRALFFLNVRDTQVGLKVFRREVAEEVMPLLLVKRYAFDLEFLVVARTLGFDRIRELPVTLDYQFQGSGMGSMAVFRALLDTFAIFYRVRILRYYQRRRALLGAHSASRALDYKPLVSLIAPTPLAAYWLGYDNLEVVAVEHEAPGTRLAAARTAHGEVLAFLADGATPAGNWITGALPFLAHREIAAVVTPTMAPNRGSTRERAAAAIGESRLGGGSMHFRFTPGNLRFVTDFPDANIVVRRDDFLAASATDPSGNLCELLAALGKQVVYTPETVVVALRPPLFRPHLAAVGRYGFECGRAVRRHGPRGLLLSIIPPVGLVVFAALGWSLLFGGPSLRDLWLILWASYFVAVGLSAVVAAAGFRSLWVGLLAAVGMIATHLTYGISFARGMLSRA